MENRTSRIRPARIDDAALLAELANHAGEGLPFYLWSGMASPGQSAWEIGRSRAEREEGSFSYANATIIEVGSVSAGCLIGYATPDEPEPIPADMPAMFVPLQALENLAPGTWYVNVLAVLPAFRGTGLGTRLLGVADDIGRKLGRRGMSVIVSNANERARQLYERVGYREAGRRTMVKEGWANDGSEWVLLTKPL
jgi:ribosomal protein S18 acetylase RimI-like enzyme